MGAACEGGRVEVRRGGAVEPYLAVLVYVQCEALLQVDVPVRKVVGLHLLIRGVQHDAHARRPVERLDAHVDVPQEAPRLDQLEAAGAHVSARDQYGRVDRFNHGRDVQAPHPAVKDALVAEALEPCWIVTSEQSGQRTEDRVARVELV
jgi:hypothetical protein